MKGLRAYDLFRGRKWLSPKPELFAENPVLQEWTKGALQGLWDLGVMPVFLAEDGHNLFRETAAANGNFVAYADLPPTPIPFPHFWMELRHGYATSCFWIESSRTLSVVFFFTHPTRKEVGIIGRGRLDYDEEMNTTGDYVDVPSDVSEFCGELLAASGFTLSLLGCKNVTKREEYLPRPVRRHPPVGITTVEHSHYVLDIPGAKEFRRAIEGAGEVGRKRLHIVRGHFADYSEGGGLFGKLHGRYYIAPHVRGNAARGTITKDYRVKANV